MEALSVVIDNYKNLENLISDYMFPVEDEVVAYDWKGSELFEGDSVYIVDSEYVRDEYEEIKEYFDSTFEKTYLEREDTNW